MNGKSFIILSFLVLLLGSCTPNQGGEDLQQALELAGRNRTELENVLQHYADDTLKYQAAAFLISNMPYHAYLEGEELKKVKSLYKKCSKYQKKDIPAVVDSFFQVHGVLDFTSLKTVNDVQAIKAALLIDHIDKAFWAWQHFPWSKNVSFHDFCEYVLPYRVGNEVPSAWRGAVLKAWKPVTDSLVASGEDNVMKVAKVVFNKLYQRHPVFSSGVPATPCVGPDIMEYNVGSCRDMSDIVQYTFRALGIPCSKEFLISGDYNTPHSWNNIPGLKRKSLWIDLASGYFKDASEYKDVKAKAFRETFSLQKDKLIDEDEVKTIPSLFRYPKFLDVTNIYADGQLMKKVVIEADALLGDSEDSKPYYLCVPNRQDWVPVDCAVMQHGKLTFENLKAGTVICIAQSHDGKMRPCSSPMRTSLENGKEAIVAFHEGGQMETIKLFTKFPPIDEPYLKNMVGATIEGADNANFLQADTIWYVKAAPTRLCSVVYPKTSRKYKYVRYCGADSTNCDIAELAFYASVADTVRLKGALIGSKGDDAKEQAKAQDGDFYTSYSSQQPSGSWIGLRFAQPQSIQKLMYVPRNRDNFIRQGDQYELFYWDKQEWRSLGIEEAKSDCISFKAPRGSLLYLRDLTRGNQERVFEYKDGKQVWW